MARRPTMPGRKRPHPLVLPVAVLLVPAIALLDYLSGPHLGFSIFYLIPVILVARVGGRISSWFTVILAALAWMIVDVATNPDYTGMLVPLWNTLTRFGFFTFALIAVRRSEEQLYSARMMALSDPLTGLPNRNYLLIMLNTARARLERYGTPLTLAFLDMDDFKKVNDLHGHVTGDHLLIRVADVLAKEVRDTDTVARMGGDEFLILIPDASVDSARAVLERVHRALQEVESPSGTSVSFSIGACTFTQPMETVEAMLALADEQMYEVKRSGKHEVAVIQVPREPDLTSTADL